MELEPVIGFEQFLEYVQSRRVVSRYNSGEEKKPDLPWWNLDKAGIDSLLKAFAQLITELLKGYPDTDKELQYLLRTAIELTHVLRSAAVKVALIGAQGAGKSLAINAIFDCDGLSLTGAEGAACTSSITRYVQYPKSTTGEDKYFAEIKFFTREEREALLQEHARSYFFYYNADDDSDDEESPRTNTVDQDQMDRSLNDTAEDIFTTLFGSYDEFLESWNVPDYKSGEFVRLCQLKCDEALKKEQVDSQGIATKMADTQNELLEQLRPFITSIKGQKGLWPLVDNISVRFHHELLQGGAEFFDLPGWGDINLSRVRHAEKIKDTVDVKIILADTIRIATDDKVINSTRAAIAHHGPSKVKVVATKIDALTENQLAQCKGEKFDRINQLLQEVEDKEAALDDNDDDDDEVNAKERRLLGQYRIYLERTQKQRKILQRADNISAELTSKLRSRLTNDMPQIFHISASEYMDWIRKPKFTFANQPSLTPDMTGIPAIRDFLFSLPAQQSLKDYERHINTTIPAFIKKIKRTVAESERDGGFRTIADDFDAHRRGYMTRLLSQAKSAFQKCSNDSMEKIEKDIPNFKEQLEEKMTAEWFILKAAAFTRIVKCRGVVPRGVSRAKGLENGCHWNKELADLLAPGFNKWYNTHTGCMATMKPALSTSLHQLHLNVTKMINDSNANMVTIEKAKKRWAPLYNRLQAKLMVLMDEVSKMEKLMYDGATMEFGQERNLISYMTDDLYTKVFEAVPEEKPPLPARSGKKKPAKRYVMPKIKFQKKVMEDLFLNPESHLIDQVLKRFQSEFDDAMRTLLEKHFDGIDKLLENLSANLRAEAPIDYRITKDGEAIRAELALHIPKLEEKAMELRSKLPHTVKPQDEMAPILWSSSDTLDGDDEDNLAIFYDKVAKTKRNDTGPTNPRPKRIKKEAS